MSGGYFDYKQYELICLADKLNDTLQIDLLEIDRTTDVEFVKSLINVSINMLKDQSIILDRLDKFLSGDDNFDNFKQKLIDELKHNNETSDINLLYKRL